MSARETEVFSIRVAKGATDRVKAWADLQGIPQGKILEEMLELYEARHEGPQPSTVETLLRPMFRVIERELGTAFEELEAKVRFYQSEGETYRERMERLELAAEEHAALLEKQRHEWTTEKATLQSQLETLAENLKAERDAREEGEAVLQEQREMARLLTESLNEARVHLAEAQQIREAHTKLAKERDVLSLQAQQLLMEKGNWELSLAAARDDLQREKETSLRAAEAYRRQIHALEHECEAKFLKAQLETEKALLAAEKAQMARIQTTEAEGASATGIEKDAKGKAQDTRATALWAQILKIYDAWEHYCQEHKGRNYVAATELEKLSGLTHAEFCDALRRALTEGLLSYEESHAPSPKALQLEGKLIEWLGFNRESGTIAKLEKMSAELKAMRLHHLGKERT